MTNLCRVECTEDTVSASSASCRSCFKRATSLQSMEYICVTTRRCSGVSLAASCTKKFKSRNGSSGCQQQRANIISLLPGGLRGSGVTSRQASQQARQQGRINYQTVPADALFIGCIVPTAQARMQEGRVVHGTACKESVELICQPLHSPLHMYGFLNRVEKSGVQFCLYRRDRHAAQEKSVSTDTFEIASEALRSTQITWG